MMQGCFDHYPHLSTITYLIVCSVCVCVVCVCVCVHVRACVVWMMVLIDWFCLLFSRKTSPAKARSRCVWCSVCVLWSCSTHMAYTTSFLGMDWTTCSSNLTVAGETVRSTDSIISKCPVVPSAVSTSEKFIVQGASICGSNHVKPVTSFMTATHHWLRLWQCVVACEANTQVFTNEGQILFIFLHAEYELEIALKKIQFNRYNVNVQWKFLKGPWKK